MLADTELFALMEEILRKNGTIHKFEQNCGAVKGRMMITLTDLPEELSAKNSGHSLFAFECTFDFYDTALCLALYTDTMQVASGIWATPQTADAETPSYEWSAFFVETLTNHIAADGSFGVPMYTFISDSGDFTVVPEKP